MLLEIHRRGVVLRFSSKTAKQPTNGQSSHRPPCQPTSPTNQAIVHASNRPDRPIDHQQSNKHRTNQRTNHPDPQINQPAGPTTNQPTNHATIQPGNQPTNHQTCYTPTQAFSQGFTNQASVHINHATNRAQLTDHQKNKPK